MWRTFDLRSGTSQQHGAEKHKHVKRVVECRRLLIQRIGQKGIYEHDRVELNSRYNPWICYQCLKPLEFQTSIRTGVLEGNKKEEALGSYLDRIVLRVLMCSTNRRAL